MADPLDYTLVRMDDNIQDKAVLTYDAANDKITDSGMTGSKGSLQTNAGTVKVGVQNMSSAGEQVIWTNRHSQVSYAPPWHIIDEVNPGGSSDRFYKATQTVVRFATRTDELENPQFQVNVPIREVIFKLNMDFPEAHNDVQIIVSPVGSPDVRMWDEVFDVSAGTNDLLLKIPIALYPGDYTFIIKPYGDINIEPPVKVMGKAQTGEVGYTVTFREFTEKPLATQEYVIATVTGGPADDVMLKSVYDTDKDGIVDLADNIEGATTAGTDKYYGTDNLGAVGFHGLPSGAVNEFHPVPFTDAVYKPDPTLVSDQIPTFIYEGTGVGTIKLPTTQKVSDNGGSMVTVVNHSTDKAVLNININSNDSYNNANLDVHTISLPSEAAVTLLASKTLRTWYVVGGLYPVDQSVLDDITKNKTDIATHDTAINGHGTQLADHANKIATNAANIKIAMQHSSSAMEEGLQNRKNAVNAIVAEVSNVHKTITLKLMSTTGLVDSALLDLSSWFSGGVQPQPGDDHKIYYGFTVKTTLPEDEILRIGTSKEVSTINSLDVTLTRSTQTPNYMWIWLPDSAGTIKGFDFSGFVSNWGAVAVNVAGVDGKLYVSPNKTSATSIEFEVKV